MLVYKRMVFVMHVTRLYIEYMHAKSMQLHAIVYGICLTKYKDQLLFVSLLLFDFFL